LWREREKGEEGCAHKIVKREKEGEREEEKIKWCQWVAEKEQSPDVAGCGINSSID
jgi:hypothetical protein